MHKAVKANNLGLIMPQAVAQSYPLICDASL
ncbi:hypothetical protein Halhy_3026 [Haliscomenobacter hydrossis DSM 1100]|uniref:Uncharacterized protein n=1 Tax=Haliscomenobacter hydrossis (strain ATCC 27775 / DSM 1100 / LMG 10767 / O) TaxID=760192 RepID=F4L6Q8_HALH1|nr:hypothetical protein Halhy_3026 [Haliscomenobacter hydrossis DSM 1100]